MYNIKFNNYHANPKNSTIYTPKEVSEFLFNLLKDKISQQGTIVDPCSGEGSLLKPWFENSYPIFGIDIIDKQGNLVNWETPNLVTDFLSLTQEFRIASHKLNLILCNPPFNGYKGKLACEVWLDKIIELFGKETPIILFTPMGFRLNSKSNGKRWKKFTNNYYPSISSIISLPRDIFPEVEFHTEILIFNIPGLQSHYFYKNHAN